MYGWPAMVMFCFDALYQLSNFPHCRCVDYILSMLGQAGSIEACGDDTSVELNPILLSKILGISNCHIVGAIV